MWKDKKYRRILLACIFASLAAVAGFFVLSRTYIKNLVYKERLNQMEEITHQMFRNLEDVIGNRWADVDVQCNYLIGTDLQTDTDLYAYLQRVSALSNLEEKQITLPGGITPSRAAEVFCGRCTTLRTTRNGSTMLPTR